MSDTSAKTISDVSPNDVLGGRGAYTYRHQGNKIYKQLVSSHLTQYRESITNQRKKDVARRIILRIREEFKGRFLEKSGNNWIDIGNDRAIAKTCQALRDEAKKLNTSNGKRKAIDSESTTESQVNDAVGAPEIPLLQQFVLNHFQSALNANQEPDIPQVVSGEEGKASNKRARCCKQDSVDSFSCTTSITTSMAQAQSTALPPLPPVSTVLHPHVPQISTHGGLGFDRRMPLQQARRREGEALRRVSFDEETFLPIPVEELRTMERMIEAREREAMAASAMMEHDLSHLLAKMSRKSFVNGQESHSLGIPQFDVGNFGDEGEDDEDDDFLSAVKGLHRRQSMGLGTDTLMSPAVARRHSLSFPSDLSDATVGAFFTAPMAGDFDPRQSIVIPEWNAGETGKGEHI